MLGTLVDLPTSGLCKLVPAQLLVQEGLGWGQVVLLRALELEDTLRRVLVLQRRNAPTEHDRDLRHALGCLEPRQEVADGIFRSFLAHHPTISVGLEVPSCMAGVVRPHI